MNRFLGLTIPALVVFLSTAPAYAKEWVIDYAHSRLGFSGMQGNAKFEGSFKKFQAKVDFDPEKPEGGTIAATIDIASVTAGSAERDAYLPQADWFNTTKFPQAQFVSTSIRADACNVVVPRPAVLVGCYKAAGMLTVKGVAKPTTLAFYLTKDGDRWHAQGGAPLTRTDFHIGEGSWASEAYVKYGVDVIIELEAKPGIP